MNTCVVFVCNKAYINKFKYTLNKLRTKGKYNKDITLVVGDDYKNNIDDFKKKYNINVVYFPEVTFPNEWLNIFKKLNRRWGSKIFQYHKLNIFKEYFKKWDYIFYLDCGLHICEDISCMLELSKKNKLLAHSDAYPKYEKKLSSQFDSNIKNIYSQLSEEYDLSCDYFQTTIMLFSTEIITNDLFDKLLYLSTKYPISLLNDQGIIALYFTNIEKNGNR